MEGIPPARESDNEDVIWALETAESLWKRNARVDAIVWLRRAAQEAAEAGDDDRASSLMVEAATLTETMARSSSQARTGAPVTMPPPEGYNSADKAKSVPPSDLGEIDDLLASGHDEGVPAEILESAVESVDDAEALDESDMIVSLAPAPPTPIPTGDPSLRDLGVHLAPLPAPPLIGPATSTEATEAEAVVASDPNPFAPEPREAAEANRITAPPPLEVSAGEASDLDAMLGDAPLAEPHDEPAPAEVAPAEVAPAEVAPAEVAPAEVPELEGITRMGADALSPMDLAGLEPFARTPDEDREQLVAGAAVLLCAADARIPDFGMAVVLEGEVVATAGEGDEIVARFGPGSVVRTVGTLGALADAHFTATADDTMLALWDEAKVKAAFARDAVVSAALYAMADRLHAWTSFTTSAMGGKLHEEVRLRLFERLAVRALRADGELIAANEVVGGLLLVGAGAIVVDGSTSGPLGPGDFVFPGATLSAGRATSSARAGEHGAIVLCADRRTTQELYATEPLLLELLAASS